MKTSPAGIALLKHFEGFRSKAYRCPAGVWTAGYGSTGPDIHEGTVFTKEQAEERLRKDLRRFEEAVSITVHVPLEQNEFDALTLLAYNIGTSAFCTSTLLKKLNKGDKAGAEASFHDWRKGGGKVLPGLVRRRKAEADLFAGRPWKS